MASLVSLGLADINSLLAVTSDKKARLENKGPTVLSGLGKRWVMIRTGPGELIKRAWQKGDHELIGAYEGKVGSMKRSSKGRSSRLPNGRRYYVNNYDVDVVAYKA